MMKRAMIALALLAILFSSLGCGGVVLSAKYSTLLDQTAAMSSQVAAMAEAGELTEAQMVTALRINANCWQNFRAARDGREVGAK